MTAPEPTRTKLGTATAAIGADRYHVDLRAMSDSLGSRHATYGQGFAGDGRAI
jgi:hypothetical protein